MSSSAARLAHGRSGCEQRPRWRHSPRQAAAAGSCSANPELTACDTEDQRLAAITISACLKSPRRQHTCKGRRVSRQVVRIQGIREIRNERTREYMELAQQKYDRAVR